MSSRAMSEGELSTAVLDLCHLHHLLVAHFRPAQTEQGWRTAVQGDGAGFPDLVIAGPGGVLYRELKDDRRPPTAEQQTWLDTLTRAGCDAGVWRPAHLRNHTIDRELRAIRSAPDGQVSRARA